MKRWKKVSLAVLSLVLISQIPFAYRRYKLGRLNAAIRALESQRRPQSNTDGFTEIKGVAHVHSFLGGHSAGTFQEIIDAALENELKFVLMSEHPAVNFDTAAMTLKGGHAGVIFINGNEVRTNSGDRLLLFPGDQHANRANQFSTQEVLSSRQSGLAFVAYPREFKSWDAIGLNGVEVYNVFSNAEKINPFLMFFDGLWSYRSYPDLLFATFYERPSDPLQQWDGEIARTGKRFVAIAGNDSHSNIGISLNDSSGNSLVGLKLDPYARSFRLVRLHVLVPGFLPGVLVVWPLDEASVMNAISAGHCFIGFDLFGDTTGFRFTAASGDRTGMMGDEISLVNEVRFRISAPLPGRIVIFKDGRELQSQNGVVETEFVVKEAGAYRVEIYLAQLPKPTGEQPWIISNPIYVR
jgi:hypothetical protein